MRSGWMETEKIPISVIYGFKYPLNQCRATSSAFSPVLKMKPKRTWYEMSVTHPLSVQGQKLLVAGAFCTY